MSAPIPAGGPRALRPPPRPTLAVAAKVYPPVPPMPEGVLVHPAANLMPMMTPEEFWDLADRVKAYGGLRDPIKRLAGPHAGKWRGAIWDGRNRYLACYVAGVDPRYEDVLWDGEESLVRMVDDLGLGRRQLSPAQKVILLQKLKEAYAEEAAERMQQGLLRAQAARADVLAKPGDGASPGLAALAADADGIPPEAKGRDLVGGARTEGGGRTSAKLAKAGKVGEVTVKRVSRILRLAPELRDVLYNETINVSQGLDLAGFSAVDRATALDRILAGENAGAVIAEVKPFASADPKVLTPKERSAARVLRGLSQERQQLVLAEGKVDLPATVPAPRSCTQPGCTAAKEGLRARPLTKGGLSYWCKDHDPGPFPEPKRPRVLGELPYVLLWSVRQQQWWAADRMGYTPKIEAAGLYAPDEAANFARGGESVPVPLRGKAPRPPRAGKRR